MNPKEMEDMAYKAGFWTANTDLGGVYWMGYHAQLQKLISLAAAAKCEELAKKIAEMPFGDTAESFAIWVRDQK